MDAFQQFNCCNLLLFVPFGQVQVKLCFRKRAIKMRLGEEKLIIALGQKNFRWVKTD